MLKTIQFSWGLVWLWYWHQPLSPMGILCDHWPRKRSWHELAKRDCSELRVVLGDADVGRSWQGGKGSRLLGMGVDSAKGVWEGRWRVVSEKIRSGVRWNIYWALRSLFCGHPFRFFCFIICSASSTLVYLAFYASFTLLLLLKATFFPIPLYAFTLFFCSVIIPLTKMAININSKIDRIIRVCHATTQRKTCTIPIASLLTWRSTKKSYCAIPEDFDGSYLKGPKETSHH